MKYKLLKECFSSEIGEIFYMRDGYCENDIRTIKLDPCIIEDNPDWFEPVIERWRARNGENYYFVNQQSIVDSLEETFHPIDEKHFDFGNYFETRKQAEEASKRIKKVLMDYHKELGE